MRFQAFEDAQGNLHITSAGAGLVFLIPGGSVVLDYQTYLEASKAPHLYTIDKDSGTVVKKHKGDK